jgi:hypothetical protein
MRVPSDMKVPVLLTLCTVEFGALAVLPTAPFVAVWLVCVAVAAWVAFA